MASGVRVTLTQRQAATAYGQRLVHTILALSHDGNLSLEEVAGLTAVLRDGPADMNAVPFLRAICRDILADNEFDDMEAYRLRRAMERAVPKAVRMKVSELLSGLGLPSDEDEGPFGGARTWRNDPATARQLDYIRNLGGCADAEMTKGAAARLIDALLQRRPPTPRQVMVMRFFDRLDLASKTKEEISAWIDDLYAQHESYERAWDRFKLDIGDDRTIQDPTIVPLGAYRQYIKAKSTTEAARTPPSVNRVSQASSREVRSSGGWLTKFMRWLIGAR